MAVKGGVVSLSITWNCNLDLDFMENCLPKYSFRILESEGYNFRHAQYHEENRRTLYKMYGIKVSYERYLISYGNHALLEALNWDIMSTQSFFIFTVSSYR